ncbi:hypothetical protein SPHV1_230053 [Novosphingobium sp. KN65.2]|nr:hypothetical protein SPHV1_230053 [Novosphingobium sp. KN65.2]
MARSYLAGIAMRHPARAQMAELVDAPSSGGGARKGVEVRVLFWAPFVLIRTFQNIAEMAEFCHS